MRNLNIFLSFFVILASSAYSNGVGVVDAQNGIYLKLLSSQVEVYVENQVAIITTTQTFKNDLGNAQNFKYAFPLYEEASAIGLNWRINGEWYEANIAPTPQDTTFPGEGENHPNLQNYLGETPLFFDIEQMLQNDSLVIVELTYVELLPYEFGNVDFHYPNDYQLIQSEILDLQELNFTLVSARTIDDVQLLSHEPETITNDGQAAYIHAIFYELPADIDYHIQYTLSLDELGLFSLSTFIEDSLVPDPYGRGFFVFVAEPDPNENANVINKVFTMIIDRSGSMSGNKIIQARDASIFIVENLNEGDKFNIVDFSSSATSYQPSHVDFNPTNEIAAINYIADLNAGGGTNISEAFNVAIPQFSTANDSTANIIIFFTDGQATDGITNTELLLSYVQTLNIQNEAEVMIFTFGIGSSVNEQLLTLLAFQNNGLAEFLGNDELEDRITAFYLLIRNPVLLNTQMTFSPSIISETYPSPLPNLFQGQQMIVAGRYQESPPVTVTLSGNAFGQSVEYEYELILADSSDEGYQFLPKIWAKKKIEYLLIQYYSLDSDLPEAEAIREEIIAISLSYGVITPFTNFSGGDPVSIESEEFTEDNNVTPQSYELLGNFPNPFNASTTIRMQININLYEFVTIKIYNSLGQLIRVLYTFVNGEGLYEIYWNGRLENGNIAATGSYFYLVDFGDSILAGTMTLLK